MFTHMTKESYLDARQDWREEYADMSLNIKVLKKAQKDAAKGGWAAANKVMSLRARMSNEATEMMTELEVLKHNSRMSVAFDRFCETQNSW